MYADWYSVSDGVSPANSGVLCFTRTSLYSLDFEQDNDLRDLVLHSPTLCNWPVLTSAVVYTFDFRRLGSNGSIWLSFNTSVAATRLQARTLRCLI